jgi:hypothetical protein
MIILLGWCLFWVFQTSRELVAAFALETIVSFHSHYRIYQFAIALGGQLRSVLVS